MSKDEFLEVFRTYDADQKPAHPTEVQRLADQMLELALDVLTAEQANRYEVMIVVSHRVDEDRGLELAAAQFCKGRETHEERLITAVEVHAEALAAICAHRPEMYDQLRTAIDVRIREHLNSMGRASE